MGMRTIRWRNGQCPRCNGQWAERIAHAGSEAVRLVPFSSLPALILDYLLTEYWTANDKSGYPYNSLHLFAREARGSVTLVTL